MERANRPFVRGLRVSVPLPSHSESDITVVANVKIFFFVSSLYSATVSVLLHIDTIGVYLFATLFGSEQIIIGTISVLVNASYGLAVDHVSRRVYFTEYRTHTIASMKTDGRYYRILINRNLVSPMAISLDTARQ